MLKIGHVGVGGFGNQICKLSVKETITTMAINSSMDDLEGMEDICTTILLGDSNGCGKDRELSKSLVKSNHTKMIDDFKSHFANHDIVFISGSGDGGTGSGAVPILVALMQKLAPGPLYIPVIVIPLITESISSQNNTKECIKELLKLNVPFIIKDNNRTNKKSLIDIYSSVNEDLIKDFKIIRGDYCQSSPYGNMDDRDRLKIIATPGLISISKITGVKENDLDNNALQDFIIQSIKDSYNVDIERDKIVKRMGFINLLPETIVSKMDKSYSEVKEYVGEPLEVFEHLTVLKEDEPGTVITIMSGLTYPMTKIESINDLINSKKEALTKKKKDDTDLFNSFDFLNGSTVLDDNKQDTTVNVDDILDQF